MTSEAATPVPDTESSATTAVPDVEKAAGNSRDDLSFRLKAGAFLATAAGIGMLGGFGTAMAATKRQDPRHFDAGMVGIDAATPKTAHSTRLGLVTHKLGQDFCLYLRSFSFEKGLSFIEYRAYWVLRNGSFKYGMQFFTVYELGISVTLRSCAGHRQSEAE
jgi:hypothetical protein